MTRTIYRSTALVTLALATLVAHGTLRAAEHDALRAAVARAMEDSQVPALAVLRIEGFRAGTELVRGVRKLGSPEQVHRGDLWHLGSDSKAMTATLIARLVEQGRLSWDARLEDLLPELAQHMLAQYRDVTLVDLLSHRSGLPENVQDATVFEGMYAKDGDPTMQRMAYVTAALREPPVGPMRGTRHYSNTGYILAGVLAERATGRPFEQLMESEVFALLGMRTVSFDQFGGPAQPSGHVDGRIADRPRDVNPAIFTPAGGGRMSLADWARFCSDAMRGVHGKGRLLRKRTYEFLQTPQGDTTAGLGWGVADSLLGRPGPVLTHSGSDGNWYALVALFPKTGDGVLVVANAAESMRGDKAALAVLRHVVTAMHPTTNEMAHPMSD